MILCSLSLLTLLLAVESWLVLQVSQSQIFEADSLALGDGTCIYYHMYTFSHKDKEEAKSQLAEELHVTSVKNYQVMVHVFPVDHLGA